MTTPRSLLSIVAEVEKAAGLPFGVIEDLSLRTGDVSMARHVAYYVGRRETRLSFQRIADEIGSGDHRGIMYGFNRVSCALADGQQWAIGLVGKVAPAFLDRAPASVLPREARP